MLLIVAAGAYLAAFTALILTRYIDPDEFEHLQFAWLLHQGLIPYRDFFEHHTPLHHFLMVPAFMLVDAASVEGALRLPFVLRGLSASFAVGTAALVYRVAARLWGRPTAVLSVALLLSHSFFLHSGIEVRGDQLCAFMLVLTAYTLIRAFPEDDGAVPRAAEPFWLGAAAFAGTAAVLATQKALFALPGLGLGLLFLARGRLNAREATRSLVPLAAGAALVAAPVLGFFAAHGSLGDFVRFNFLLNAKWTRDYQLGNLAAVALLQVVNDLLFCSVAACGGALMALGAARKENRRAVAAVLMPLASMVAGLAVIPVATQEYVFLLVPFAAMAGAWGAVRVSVWPGLAGGRSSLLPRGVLAAAALYSSLHFASAFAAHDLEGRDPGASLRRLAYVVGSTSPDSTILTGWTGSTGAALRRPAFFYHMLHREVRTLIAPDEYARLLEGLRSGAVRPEIVALDRDLRALPEEIVAFLVAAYEPTGTEPLWRRKPDAPVP